MQLNPAATGIRNVGPPVAAGAAALLVGAAVAFDQIILAAAIVGGVLAILLLGAGVTTWTAALIGATVLTRLPVEILGLPSALNFVHYAIVPLFVVAALRRPPNPEEDQGPRLWLIGMLVVAISSMILNLTHPVRAILFLAIIGEPVVVIWALQRWGPNGHEVRRIGLIALAVLAIQVPVGAYQAVTVGISDHLQGTLSGHGAGHHVLGGLNALGLFVFINGMLTRRIPLLTGAFGSLVAVAMILVTGSIQVALAMTAALVAMVLTRNRALRRSRTGGRRTAAAGAALLLALAAPFMAEAVVPGTINRALRLLNPEKFPEVTLMVETARENQVQLLVGQGPGTTASRASVLLTPEQMKRGSPLAVLGIGPTEFALRVVTQSRSGACEGCPGGGSAESYVSTVYGVLGDLGLVGIAGLFAVFYGAWRRLGRSEAFYAPAGRAALVMSFILIFVDNWIEYPEYGVPLAVLIGITLRPTRKTASPVEDLESGGQRALVGVGAPQS